MLQFSITSRVPRRNCLHILSIHCISCTVPLFGKKVDIKNDFNKSIENNIVHITSINAQTNERSIVQLKLPSPSKSWKSRYEFVHNSLYTREFILPDEAIDGLRNTLLSCERSPKQLQHEADQLTERLTQRRFPASSSVVRDARNKIKEMLSKKYGDWKENNCISDEKTVIFWTIYYEKSNIRSLTHVKYTCALNVFSY
uniref:DUF4806 domain-containing protein n=1 Tax=Heterorhabditis bacteriophora TaxID=37862 RepID=A0A1I7W7M2_HETBA